MRNMKKLSIAIAALTVSGTLGSSVMAISHSDLGEVRSIVEAGEAAALRAFLLESGDAVMDQSPLGIMLRDWLMSDTSQSSFFTAVGWQAQFPEALMQAVEASKTDSSLY